jgi:hypothetical protein
LPSRRSRWLPRAGALDLRWVNAPAANERHTGLWSNRSRSRLGSTAAHSWLDIKAP